MVDYQKILCTSEDEWFDDCKTYVDRCTFKTGDIHYLFRDVNNGWHARHVSQSVDPAWELVYLANPQTKH